MTRTDERRAWIVEQWLSGRTQAAIGAELGMTQGAVAFQIRMFCEDAGTDTPRIWGTEAYGAMRRGFAAEALQIHRGQPPAPRPRRPRPPADIPWPPPFRPKPPDARQARAEHAWLLRAEGCKFHEIAARLGVSTDRARQLVLKFAYKMQWAMRHARFRFE